MRCNGMTGGVEGDGLVVAYKRVGAGLGERLIVLQDFLEGFGTCAKGACIVRPVGTRGGQAVVEDTYRG